MWFPPIQPALVVERSIWIVGTFVGVGAVVRDGVVIPGPIFRAGRELFMIESRNEGDMAAMKFVALAEGEAFGLTAPDVPGVGYVAPDLSAPAPESRFGGMIERLQQKFARPTAVPPDSEVL